MQVVEIFASIQGEGKFIGTPSTFIRLAGCNLRPPCKWCDTKYALDTKVGQTLTPFKVASEGHDRGRIHVVLTGGEPLLHPHGELTELAGLLYHQGHIITVETNATLMPPLSLKRYVALWSLSPKLPSAKVETRVDWRNVVDYVARNMQAATQVKFVISDERDMLVAAAYARVERAYHYILQPEGYRAYDGTVQGTTRREALEHYMDTYRRLVELAQGHFPIDQVSVQILPQLHVLVWGRQRGV